MTQPDDSAGHIHIVIGPGGRNVQVGSGMVQNNVFGSGPEDPDWDEAEEDAPEPSWDPGDEVEDQGGMSEFDPRADEVARQEWEQFGPEMGG
jgi:hypothetical protein